MTKSIAYNLVDVIVKSDTINHEPYLKAVIAPRNCAIGKLLSWEIEVIHEKKVLCRSERTSKPDFHFPLTDDGLYLVRVWVYTDNRGCSYTQRGFHYYSDNLRREYKSFVNSIDASGLPIKQIPLFYPDAPYQNIAAIVMENPKQREALLKAFRNPHANNNPLQITEIFAKSGERSSIFVLSQKSPQRLSDKNKIVFSGKAIYDDRLIVGYDEVYPSFNIPELLDSTGNFSAFCWDDERLVITNDFYGLSRITYYEDANLFAISNSYHLLLSILTSIEVRLELLDDIPVIPLLSEGGLFLQQRMSHSMDIKGTRLLPIDKGFVIASNGERRTFSKTLANTLNSENRQDEQDLCNRIACDELTRAIDTILKDERYISTRFDLTGGKDSRIIFAGIEKLGRRAKSNVQIHFVKASDYEKQIVCKLKEISGIPWDTTPEENIITNMEQNEHAHRSLTMGLTYARGFRRSARNEQLPPYACIQGGGGDGLYRPYYALLFANIDFEASEIQVADNLLMYFENNALFSPANLSKSFIKEMSTALNEIGGASIKERFNNHYIYFRNSTHFGTQFAINSMFEHYDYWQPLMTKSAIRALHNALSHDYGLRNQIEITRILDSRTISIPYENAGDQKEQSIILKSYNMTIDATGLEFADDDSYEKSEQKKRDVTSIETPDELQLELNAINSSYANGFFERFEIALKKLLIFNDGQYDNEIGLGLYLYLKQQSERAAGKSIPSKGAIMTYNKLISIIDQLEVTHPGDTWETLSKPTTMAESNISD